MEERISGTEDTIEEMDTSVKESVKSSNCLIQIIQEVWDTMKQPKIRIAGIEESQLKGLEHIFNRVIEKNFS